MAADPSSFGGRTMTGNRHERRKQAVLDRTEHMQTLHREAGGMICFEVVTPETVLLHPDWDDMLCAIGRWLQQRNPEFPPLCLACETGWPTEDDTPAAFMIIRPWQSRGTVWSLIGICDDCARRHDLHDRCAAFVKSIWPDGRIIRNVHPAPGGLQ
jgi:hypothetical protein